MNGFEKEDFDPAETGIEKKLFCRKSVTKVPGKHLAENPFISRAMGYRLAISVKNDLVTCLFPRRFRKVFFK